MPVATPTNPPINRLRGAWDSGTAYARGDVVLYAGSCYAAATASLNVAPDSDATRWQQLAAKGQDATAQAFANATARNAATPAYAGQLGVQLDDGSLWRAVSTTAGNWANVLLVYPSGATFGGAVYIPSGGFGNADNVADNNAAHGAQTVILGPDSKNAGTDQYLACFLTNDPAADNPLSLGAFARGVAGVIDLVASYCGAQVVTLCLNGSPSGPVAVGKTSANFTFDVAGDINSDGVLRVGNAQVVGPPASIPDATDGVNSGSADLASLQAVIDLLRAHGLATT